MNQGKISVGDARELSRKHNCPVVLVFAISASGEQFHVTSYGANKALCRHAASFAEQIAAKVLNAEIAPEAKEPERLPTEPTLWERKR